MDKTGWNFRHGKYHEENKRTLLKSYGLKFILNVTGKAGKFDITKTVIILVTGLGLMGLANLFCDFLLINCSSKVRKQVLDKKYEEIDAKISEKALAENLVNLLRQGGTSDEIAKFIMAVSYHALLQNKKETTTPSKEENNAEFV